MHRPDRPRLPEAAIEIVGDRQRVGVREDDRVERGALLVVGVDAREVLLDERSAGQRAVAERRFDLRNRGLVEGKRTRCLGERDRADEEGEEGERPAHAR